MRHRLPNGNAGLSRMRGVRDASFVIFLTSRPETRGDTAQAQSHRWLANKGFLQPSVFVVHGSRGKIAASLALDVIVDDRPENCLDVAVDSVCVHGDTPGAPDIARAVRDALGKAKVKVAPFRS